MPVPLPGGSSGEPVAERSRAAAGLGGVSCRPWEAVLSADTARAGAPEETRGRLQGFDLVFRLNFGSPIASTRERPRLLFKQPVGGGGNHRKALK